MFLNLSNHPSAGWSEGQLREAVALGFGPVRDVPLPPVPAAAETAAVEALAAELVTGLPAEARAAFLATEFTLTVALLRLLQRRGVRAFTATTDRVHVEELGDEGVVRIRKEFRFVRWREYPHL